MTYKLNPNLFVEHGAAVLALRVRTSARAFKLLNRAAAIGECRPIDLAA